MCFRFSEYLACFICRRCLYLAAAFYFGRLFSLPTCPSKSGTTPRLRDAGSASVSRQLDRTDLAPGGRRLNDLDVLAKPGLPVYRHHQTAQRTRPIPVHRLNEGRRRHARTDHYQPPLYRLRKAWANAVSHIAWTEFSPRRCRKTGA